MCSKGVLKQPLILVWLKDDTNLVVHLFVDEKLQYNHEVRNV